VNEQIPISPGDGRLDRVRTDPEFHRAAFQLRGWNATTGAQLAGLTYQTVADILGRQTRRDKDGLVAIDLKTLFALKTAYARYRPIYIIALPPQGPPVRRKLPNKMTGPLPGMAGRRQLPNGVEEPDAQAPDS
jgi:hypothetical protein